MYRFTKILFPTETFPDGPDGRCPGVTVLYGRTRPDLAPETRHGPQGLETGRRPGSDPRGESRPKLTSES